MELTPAQVTLIEFFREPELPVINEDLRFAFTNLSLTKDVMELAENSYDRLAGILELWNTVIILDKERKELNNAI